MIVRRQPDAESGDIVIVTVGDEEATCKKLQKTPDGLMLISLNPAYAPMFYSRRECASLPVRIYGRVVERTVENGFAQDGEVAYRGDPAAPEDYSRRWETVMDDSRAVVTGRTSPVYRGALVVCQGGNQPAVRLAVTEAVAALTGLTADRITVAKWQ